MATQPTIPNGTSPTLREILSARIANAILHPKTTIQSLITSLLFLDALLVACHCLPVKYAAIWGGLMSAVKVIVGMGQHDGAQISLPAGTTLDTTSHLETPGAVITYLTQVGL